METCRENFIEFNGNEAKERKEDGNKRKGTKNKAKRKNNEMEIRC